MRSRILRIEETASEKWWSGYKLKTMGLICKLKTMSLIYKVKTMGLI